MVADVPQPTQYRCIPRELMLRMPFDWAQIYTCLTQLAAEEYVTLFQEDGVRYSITQAGVDKVCELLDESENIKTIFS